MRRLMRVGLLTLAIAAAWISALPSAPVRQPMAFAHTRHQTVACTVCHSGAATAVRAGIPDAALCAKCHTTVPDGSSATWSDATARGPIRWVRVARVPDHVLFSHRRHVTLARLECASCHGEVGSRAAPVTARAVRLEMDTCVSCHREERAAEDCAACHR